MKKAFFCYCENKDEVTATLISAFVSATLLERFIYFLYSKSQASFHLLWVHSPEPGLCWTWSETPKTGFLMTRLNYGKTRVYRGAQFFLFFLNHRLWVIVRTVALRRY